MEHSSVQNFKSKKWKHHKVSSVVIPVPLSTVDETLSQIDKNKNLNYHLCFRDKWWQNFILEDFGAPSLSRGPGSLPPCPPSRRPWIRELLTIFCTFHFFAGLFGGKLMYQCFPHVLIVGWGTAFLQQNIWGNGVTPAFPPLHHVM